MNIRNAIALTACAFMAIAVGCEKKTASNTTGSKGNTNTPAGAVIPANYFVETSPANAKPIVEVKKGAKAGDAVVMEGRIAGRVDPFTAGRASFMMTDMSLAVCQDDCKTPWDHCCDEPKDIAANAATVQLVDDKGEIIKVQANGVHGLAPNVELIVVGTVKSLDENGNMVVDAKQVYVKKS